MKKYIKTITQDKSITFHNIEYSETYHSITGAETEAIYKYIKPSNLKERIKHKQIKILDLPFGIGLNSLCTIDFLNQNSGKIKITAIEKDERACFLLLDEKIKRPWKKILKKLKNKNFIKKPNYSINLLIGDARNIVKNLNEKFDIIFLDPFSPAKNPELWTFDFFKELYKKLENNGVILTYSSALPVRAGFIKAGFYIGQTKPVGRKRGGTIAAKSKDFINNNIDKKDLYLLKYSTGKIPYRDKTLNSTKNEIINYREKIKKIMVEKSILKTVKKSLKNIS